MTSYLYREASGYDETFTAADDQTAKDYARDLLRAGDYGVIERTTRVGAYVYPAGDEDAAGFPVTVDLRPAEPACTSTEGHDWQDGQPYGSDHGGVRWTDTCSRCGLRRTTDTGGTDHATGSQMEITSYDSAAASDRDD